MSLLSGYVFSHCQHMSLLSVLVYSLGQQMSLLSVSVYSLSQQMPLFSISLLSRPTGVIPLSMSMRYLLLLTDVSCFRLCSLTTAILYNCHLGVPPSFRFCLRYGWLRHCLSFIYLTPDVSPTLYLSCLYWLADVSICLPVNTCVFSLWFSCIYCTFWRKA